MLFVGLIASSEMLLFIGIHAFLSSSQRSRLKAWYICGSVDHIYI